MTGHNPPSPSLAELVEAMRSLIPAAVAPVAPVAPIAPIETGIAKHAGTVVAAIMLALAFWVATTVMALTTTMAQVLVTTDAIKKQLEVDTPRVQEVVTKQASQGTRLDGVEQGQAQIRDRIRILEGQKPLRAALE